MEKTVSGAPARVEAPSPGEGAIPGMAFPLAATARLAGREELTSPLLPGLRIGISSVFADAGDIMV